MITSPAASAMGPSPRAVLSLHAIRTWLAASFAGLTWRRAGLALLVLLVFALSRPPVRMAVFGGKGLVAVLEASLQPIFVIFCRFVPMLLFVVLAANRGPASGGRRIACLVGALAAGATVGTLIVAAALPALFPDAVLLKVVDPTAPRLLQAWRWFGISLGDFAISVTVTVFWYYFKRNADAATALFRAEHGREEVERESAEARLLVMQAQIEPHFLFNTLASIRRLYETDRAAGRAMLRHLASYLTVSLPALRAEHSTLGRELALAAAYLNVQKIRMGARLDVEVDVPESLHAITVPPMMLATLVENAIMHGIGPLPQGGRIRIAAATQGDDLVIEVADDGRGLQDAWGTGVGLANIGARLQSQYGERASVLLVNGRDRGAVATLRFPAAAEASPSS